MQKKTKMKPPILHIEMDTKARHEMIDWLLEKADDIDYYYFHQRIQNIFLDSQQ